MAAVFDRSSRRARALPGAVIGPIWSMFSAERLWSRNETDPAVRLSDVAAYVLLARVAAPADGCGRRRDLAARGCGRALGALRDGRVLRNDRGRGGMVPVRMQ